MARPEVHEPFAKQGIDIFHLNPQQLRDFLHSEAARLGNLLNHSRVKASSQQRHFAGCASAFGDLFRRHSRHV